jgi:hypothetical protein
MLLPPCSMFPIMHSQDTQILSRCQAAASQIPQQKQSHADPTHGCHLHLS